MTTPAEIHAHLRAVKAKGRRVVFVPTMGFLHEGHTSLMKLARSHAPEGELVVSIFVNPAQFGPQEDLARYPRDLDRDRRLCREAGVDTLFTPDAAGIYPDGFDTRVDPGRLATVFEGAIRPGHFSGVCTVVLKLFNLVAPDAAVFGQKDAQQVAVIRQMVRDLALPVDLVVGPTRREPDGLAMSSRNVYLDGDQRRQATGLHEALKAAREAIEAGERNGDALRRLMAGQIDRQPLARLDYAEIVHPDTFQSLDTLAGSALLLVAAKFGATRLIDNELLAIP